MVQLNQFAPNEPVDGLYVYQANLPQLHNPIISASQETALTYGAFVAIDTASTNADAPVVLQANDDDPVFGVIAFTPVKAQFTAGERVALARANDIIWKAKDSNAITAGAPLYFDDSTNKVTATATAGNTIIGKAITAAAATDGFVQVELGFQTTESEG